MIEIGNMEHGRVIAEASKCSYTPSFDVVVSRVTNGVLRGGVVYTDYTGASISVHIAGFDPLWINRTIRWIVVDYAFNQLGCKKLIGHIPADNHISLEFAKKLGFKEETQISDYFPEGSLVIVSLRRGDCKWLNSKKGVNLRRSSDG